MLPVYIGLGILGLLAWKAQSGNRPGMTQQERLTYESALAKDNPPPSADYYRGLANKFDDRGFTYEASILRKRAAVRDLPADQQAALAQAFKKGLSSKDPVEVRALANAYEAEGFFGNASALRRWANQLDVAASIAQTQAVRDAQMNAASASAAEIAHAQAGPAVKAKTSPVEDLTNKVVGRAVETMAAEAVKLGVPTPSAATMSNAVNSVVGPAAGDAVKSAEGAASQVLGSIF